MSKALTSNGYFLDLFFLEKPLEAIENSKFLSCIQSGLFHIGLRIDNITTKKDFMARTRSVPVNRYVRIPRGFLGNYDDRVFKRSSLEVITYDPRKEMKEGGVKLDTNVQFDNAFFHDSRYLSAHLVKYPIRMADGSIKNYTVIKISYNYKLKNAFPSIVDINAFVGMYMTNIYNCEGIYTRAGSFARSEDIALSYFQGQEKSKLEGIDTCINYVHQTSKVEETYGINCRQIMDAIDTYMSILYAPDDLMEVESMRRKHFERYGLNRPEIYTKIDAIMQDWSTRTQTFTDEQQKIKPITNLVRQMLNKEADLSSVMVDAETAAGSDKKKAETLKLTSIERIVEDLTSLLISHVTIKNNLYKEVPLREFYFKVERIPAQVSS